jgi:diacylglycerol kinase family enzyme
LARTLGLDAGAIDGNGTEVAVDVMNVRLEAGAVEPAVNAVVVGTAPGSTRWFTRSRTVQVTVDGGEVFAGRATGVVIASGQYLHGGDVNPRSHPGDGQVEVQVYALVAAARAPMRRRLLTGTHVPHPGVTQRAGRDVIVTASRPLAVEVDGVARTRAREVTIHLEAGALRLLL